MIDILVDEDIDEHPLPEADMVRRAVLAALEGAGLPAAAEPDLCIRFASDAAVREMNRQWRHQDKVTDVLSFPLQDGPDVDVSGGLGDIALAVPFVLREAERLALPPRDHCLHLIVHACLHLVGFDHIDDADAAEMQGRERRIMQALGLHDPWPDEERR